MVVTAPTFFDIDRFPSTAISDMMTEDEVLKRISMKKSIKNAVQQHPYKIYHSEQCGWWTDVDDPTQKNRKKRIRKCSKEKLWLALAEWYENLDKKNISLSELYPEWLEHKETETPKNAKNIQRIKASWKAYYADEPLSQKLIQMPMHEITVNDLRKWAEALIKKITLWTRKSSLGCSASYGNASNMLLMRMTPSFRKTFGKKQERKSTRI